MLYHFQSDLLYDKTYGGMTQILTSQRVASVIHADEILVISKGKIIERGRHEELLAQLGSYAQLWYNESNTKRDLYSVVY